MTDSGPRADYSAIAGSYDAARRLPEGAIESAAAEVATEQMTLVIGEK